MLSCESSESEVDRGKSEQTDVSAPVDLAEADIFCL